MTNTSHEWVPGATAWDGFRSLHPELGLASGKWAFHNFLRRYRGVLAAADAIRLANGRFWIAHQSRFAELAFECATGRGEAVVGHALSSGHQRPYRGTDKQDRPPASLIDSGAVRATVQDQLIN